MTKQEIEDVKLEIAYLEQINFEEGLDSEMRYYLKKLKEQLTLTDVVASDFLKTDQEKEE